MITSGQHQALASTSNPKVHNYPQFVLELEEALLARRCCRQMHPPNCRAVSHLTKAQVFLRKKPGAGFCALFQYCRGEGQLASEYGRFRHAKLRSAACDHMPRAWRIFSKAK